MVTEIESSRTNNPYYRFYFISNKLNVTATKDKRKKSHYLKIEKWRAIRKYVEMSKNIKELRHAMTFLRVTFLRKQNISRRKRRYRMIYVATSLQHMHFLVQCWCRFLFLGHRFYDKCINSYLHRNHKVFSFIQICATCIVPFHFDYIYNC